MNKLFIYGVIMLFAGLVAFHVSNALLINEREGLAASAPASSKSKTVPIPVPVPVGAVVPVATSANSVSACGDDCSAYDEINAVLGRFNALKTQHEKGNDAFKKVDTDLIKLSKSVKNMGNKKTPGGRPPIDKKMLS